MANIRGHLGEKGYHTADRGERTGDAGTYEGRDSETKRGRCVNKKNKGIRATQR